MNENDTYSKLKQVILSRRSIRRFSNEPVPESVITEMLDCARWAPSDTNQQPWRFIVVTNKALISQISSLVWDRLKSLESEALSQGKPAVARKIKVFGKYAAFFVNAPALIFVIAEPYRSRFTEEIFSELGRSDVWSMESLKSVSFASQNLLLAAHALGYGACPMSGPLLVAGKEIKETLNLDQEADIVLVIAVGKPEHIPKSSGRKSIDEITTWIR